MKKYIIALFALILGLTGCKKEDNGNLLARAKQHIDESIQTFKSQGGDEVITDTLICNDSILIVYGQMITSNGMTIPEEMIFVRQRTDKGFAYFIDCRILLQFGQRSITEGVVVNSTPCNKALLKTLLHNDENKLVASKVLYTKALAECLKKKTPLKDIKQD